MRKFLSAILFVCCVFQAGFTYAEEAEFDYRADTPSVFMVADFEGNQNKNNLGGDFGAWESDPKDPDQSLSLSIVPSDLEGSSKCLKLDYDMDAEVPSQGGFWMRMMYGNFSSYDHLELFVKGDAEKGHTSKLIVEFSKWKTDKKKEKIQTNYIVENIKPYWQKVIIPLNELNGFSSWDRKTEWRDVLEMSINMPDKVLDVKQGTVYIDNISFTKTTNPGPHIYDWVERRVPKTLLELDAQQWGQFLIDRLYGFPKEVVGKYDFPKEDDAFLRRLATDTWKYFENIVDSETGIVLDNVVISESKDKITKPVIGDYTNVTNIGVYFMALVGANELGLIDRAETLRRAKQTIHSLEKMEKYFDYFYNYYDSSNLERTTNFISSVDSGWLIAGLYVIKNFFPEDKELQRAVNELVDGHNFKIFYNDLEQHLSHGFYVNIGQRAAYNYGVFFAEPRATSYIAIARGDIPVDHWFHMNRTFPPSFTWQNQKPTDYKQKECLGVKYNAGYYVDAKDGYKFIPSWGGSLFEALMPSMVLMEKDLAPNGLGYNNAMHVRGHIKYAKEDLGYEVWGMSPCTIPEGGYTEYGVAQLGAKGYHPGVVTPHVSFLALEYAPKEAIANLRKMLELYPDIYGEYGFYDAVTVKTGKVPYKYLCLDQGMSFVGLANYLTGGKIREYFNKEPIFKEAQKLLTEEKLFD